MVGTGFPLFSWGHLLLLVLVPALAAVLAWRGRRNRTTANRIRISLGVLLLVDSAAWYSWNLYHGWLRFPDRVPLQISHLVAFTAIAAALTANQWAFEMTYFIGLTTAYPTLVTPDLYAPLWSYETIRFWIEHAGVTIIALYLVLSRLRRPRRGSWWRAYLVLNAYAAAILAFNLHFGTNYFYLMRKPDMQTLLDLFGPWPYYLLVLNAAAFVAFWLMYLPFRHPGTPAGRPAEEPEDTSPRR